MYIRRDLVSHLFINDLGNGLGPALMPGVVTGTGGGHVSMDCGVVDAGFWWCVFGRLLESCSIAEQGRAAGNTRDQAE